MAQRTSNIPYPIQLSPYSRGRQYVYIGDKKTDNTVRGLAAPKPVKIFVPQERWRIQSETRLPSQPSITKTRSDSKPPTGKPPSGRSHRDIKTSSLRIRRSSEDRCQRFRRTSPGITTERLKTKASWQTDREYSTPSIPRCSRLSSQRFQTETWGSINNGIKAQVPRKSSSQKISDRASNSRLTRTSLQQNPAKERCQQGSQTSSARLNTSLQKRASRQNYREVNRAILCTNRNSRLKESGFADDQATIVALNYQWKDEVEFIRNDIFTDARSLNGKIVVYPPKLFWVRKGQPTPANLCICRLLREIQYCSEEFSSNYPRHISIIEFHDCLPSVKASTFSTIQTTHTSFQLCRVPLYHVGAQLRLLHRPPDKTVGTSQGLQIWEAPDVETGIREKEQLLRYVERVYLRHKSTFEEIVNAYIRLISASRRIRANAYQTLSIKYTESEDSVRLSDSETWFVQHNVRKLQNDYGKTIRRADRGVVPFIFGFASMVNNRPLLEGCAWQFAEIQIPSWTWFEVRNFRPVLLAPIRIIPSNGHDKTEFETNIAVSHPKVKTAGERRLRRRASTHTVERPMAKMTRVLEPRNLPYPSPSEAQQISLTQEAIKAELASYTNKDEIWRKLCQRNEQEEEAIETEPTAAKADTSEDRTKSPGRGSLLSRWMNRSRNSASKTSKSKEKQKATNLEKVTVISTNGSLNDAKKHSGITSEQLANCEGSEKSNQSSTTGEFPSGSSKSGRKNWRDRFKISDSGIKKT